MKEEHARVVANVLMGVAAAGVAYCVLRNPPLRRLAWQLAAASLTGTVPRWFAAEVRNAWETSRIVA